MTSDDRISALFGYGLAGPFFELSINRDDFGARRLQFSTAGRDIERVSARTNDHDQLVSCDDRWIFFVKTKPRSFWHVMTFTSKCRDAVAASNYLSISPLRTVRQTDTLNGRTVRGYRLGLSFGGSL